MQQVVEELRVLDRCGSAMKKGCSCNELWLRRLIVCVLRWDDEDDDPCAADLEFFAAMVMITFGISTLMARKWCRRSDGRVVALLLMLQGGARVDSGDPASWQTHHGSLCRSVEALDRHS